MLQLIYEKYLPPLDTKKIQIEILKNCQVDT